MKPDYVIKRELNLDPGAVCHNYEDIKVAIYTYRRNDKFIAVAYQGKRAKESWAYSFKTDLERQKYINEFLMDTSEIKDFKAKRAEEEKIREMEKFKDIKVGDIFHQGGGYEQTNCYFYQLVNLKGKTGTFKRIASDIVPGSEGFMSCQRTPSPDNFIGEAVKYRIKGDRIKPGYECAYKCDPKKSFYNSWYA